LNTKIIRKIMFLFNKARLATAEIILPARFFVQERSYACFYKNAFPGFRSRIAEFNYRPDKLSRDANRWFMLNLILGQVKTCELGDYAELGTYRGKTARVIHQNMNQGSCLYCFDTFEGFSSDDVTSETKYSEVDVNAGLYGDTNMEIVRRYVLETRDEGSLILKKGHFPETFRDLENKRWRFVHLDCDLSEPMKAGLEIFWPKMVAGGIIVVHDYNGHYAEGVQKAVSDFCRNTGTVPVPMNDSAGSAVIVKNIL